MQTNKVKDLASPSHTNSPSIDDGTPATRRKIAAFGNDFHTNSKANWYHCKGEENSLL